MCDFESSCSYLTEVEDPEVQERDNKIRDLTFENQHLEDVNKKLQSSLESVKQQLKDTMMAVDRSNDINEQIQTLKKQVLDLTEKKEQLEQQLSSVEDSKDEATAQLSRNISSISEERDELKENLAGANQAISKLKKKNNALKVENQENAELLQAVAEDIQRIKAKKRKLEQKLEVTSEKLATTENENEQKVFEIQRLNNEKSVLVSENDSLKVKVDAATSLNQETEQTIAALRRESESKVELINTFEEQLTAQKDELASFVDDRERMLELISKQQKSLIFAESAIEKLVNENAALKTKAKANAKPVQKPFATEHEFSSLVMPFTGELKAKCQHIMKLAQYQPFQRIQLVLNEASKAISETSSELKVRERKVVEAESAYDNFAVDQVKYQEILEALIEELKHLVLNQELINENPTCDKNTEFVDFVADKLESLTSILKRESIKDPQYIPNDFFFSSNVDERKEAVKKLLEPTDSTFALFSAQFIANVYLEQQLSAVTAPLQLIDSMTKSGVLRGMSLSDVPRLIEAQNLKSNKVLTQNKKLKEKMKKLNSQYFESIKSENEKKTKISELTLKVEDQKNEIDVLNVKLQVAHNELLLKKSECGSLNQLAQEIRNGVEESTNDQKQRTDSLEEALKEKTKECAELSQILGELEKSIEENNNAQLKRARKNEESLVAQIEILQSQVDEYEEVLARKKKAAKKNEKILNEKYEKSVAELSKSYEEGKKNLEMTIDSLKEKAQSSSEASKKLIDNMSEVEKKNAQLIKDNTELNQKLKGIQSEIIALKNSAKKEKQQQQAQVAAQIIACENNAQQQISVEKAKLTTKVSELLQKAHEALGTFYGLGDDEFDEEAYEQTVRNAREDLEKLHYFQEEATKLPK